MNAVSMVVRCLQRQQCAEGPLSINGAWASDHTVPDRGPIMKSSDTGISGVQPIPPEDYAAWG